MTFLGKLTGLARRCRLRGRAGGGERHHDRPRVDQLRRGGTAELGLFEARRLAPSFVVMDSASSATGS
jgi:hypothetical protein